MSQTTLLILLSAAAVVSAALSFLAWARLAHPPRARVEPDEPDAAEEADGGAERTDAEVNDIPDEDDRDPPT